jgi:hypothetical protein
MKSDLYGPYKLGVGVLQRQKTKSYAIRKFKANLKKLPRSEYWLQLANMKLESLVIVNHHVTVNQYLDFAHTARHMLGESFNQNPDSFIFNCNILLKNSLYIYIK